MPARPAGTFIGMLKDADQEYGSTCTDGDWTEVNTSALVTVDEAVAGLIALATAAAVADFVVADLSEEVVSLLATEDVFFVSDVVEFVFEAILPLFPVSA